MATRRQSRKPQRKAEKARSRQQSRTRPADGLSQRHPDLDHLAGRPPTAETLISLQRTFGNHFVQKFVEQRENGAEPGSRPGKDDRRSANSRMIQREMVEADDLGTGVFTHAKHPGGKFLKVDEGGRTYYKNITTQKYYSYDGARDDLDEVAGPGAFALEQQDKVSFKTINPGFVVGSLAPPAGPPPGAHRVGFVANVPATPDKSLADIARHYRAGFANRADANSRMALVIGLNVYDKDNPAARINQALDDFRGNWDVNNFPVGVFAFVWKHSDIERGVKKIGQDTIPYGEIRDKIAQHPFTSLFTSQLRAVGGCDRVYVHTGDADVQGFGTAGGPELFDAAAAKLGGAGEIDVLSGGYDVRQVGRGGDVEVKKRLAIHASRLDMAVRQAMAGRKVEAVYFPEPNTFFRIQDWANTLEHGVSFGTGSKEGGQVVSNLSKANTRQGATKEFDKNLAIPTSGDRITKSFGDLPPGAVPVNKAIIEELIGGLTQTHARPQTWQDQAESAFGPNPKLWQTLRNATFRDIAVDFNLDKIKTLTAGAAKLAFEAEIMAQIETKADRTAAKDAILFAWATRSALLTTLKAIISDLEGGA